MSTTTTNTHTNTTAAGEAFLPAQARSTTGPLTEARAAALLDAGTILPVGSTDRDDADTLTARTYTHTALGDRPVVRLVPGTLGEAEDLALEFLGLERTAEAPVVGQVRRETLGFPAWALVNDPANGHHALALVKDIERLGRQARTRAGAAKEGFDALGTRLGRAVPHFLPTYYEQVARLFLQAENTTYAASFFGKAREAERVHGLEVDEDRQRAVFLEFAFAGALTVKALRQYVRDLVARLAPEDAWAQFRRLLVERCAAGMPPYAALPQDVRVLVKAAGLDREAAESELVVDLIGSPGVVRAPASFWTAYRSSLVALALRDTAVRTRLLGFFPENFSESGRDTDGERDWLALLAESGAEELLTALPDTSDSAAAATAAPAEPSVSPADWLARWEAHRRRNRVTSGRSPQTLGLAARMADRLRADGRSVELFQGRWQRTADLDLLDLCLASGVPVAEPDDQGPDTTQSPGLPLGSWLTETVPGARDLTALAERPFFRALLRRTVGALGSGRGQGMGDAGMAKLAAHPVLSGILREWLTDCAEEYAAARGLPGLHTALNRLSAFRSVAADVAPDAVRLLEKHDVVPLLAATLRTGVLDELGWPALDETYAELAAEAESGARQRHHRSEGVGVTGAWPALILNTPERAVVVGPEGVLLRHTLRLPATIDQWRTLAFRYVDGELLVIWWEDGKQRGYWSHRPAEVFAVGGEQIPRWGGSGPSDEVCLPLPGGGRATGGKALHAGDTSLPPQRAVISDGTGYWREGRQGTQTVWLEYDPAGGTHGRASLPAFLRSGVRDGSRLLTEHCQVLPLQPGLETTPFGTDGKVLGRWVRRTVTEPGTAAPADGHRTAVGTPDGHTVTLPYPLPGNGTPVPLGALTLPGGSRPVAVLRHRSVDAHPADTDGTGGSLWSVTPDSSGGNDAAGTPYVPPVAYWHALRPRDQRGSTALRNLTDSRARELFEVVATEVARHLEAFRAVEEYTGPSARELSEKAVARALPEVSDVRLLAGVTALVREAVDRAASVARYLAPPKPAQPATPRNTARTQGMFFDQEPEHGDDTTLQTASALHSERMRGGWWGGGKRWTAIRQILAVNHVLGGEPAFGPPIASTTPFTSVDGWQRDEYTVPGDSLTWASHLDYLPELAYRAASEATSAEHRAALLVFLETLAAGPLADPAGTVRQVELVEPYSTGTAPGRPESVHRVGHVLRKGTRTVVIIANRGRNYQNDVARWLALDHDPTGAFGPVPGFTLDWEYVHRHGIDPGRLTRLTALVREQGPAPWRPEAAEAFDTATGIGPLQSVALLSAAVEEPGADVLALLGAKTRAFEAAQARLDALPREDRHAVQRALLPADPAELWSTGPDVVAAAEVWKQRLGSLVRVPEELDLDLSGTGPGAVDLILNTDSRTWLAHGTDVPDGTGRPSLRRVSARGAVSSALTALRTLAYTLPYGHPLRAHLPVGLAALRTRLADPGLVLDLGLDWTESGHSIGPVIRAAHGLPESGGAGPDGLVRAGSALLLAPGHGTSEKVLIRPAGLTGPEDPAFGLVEGTVAPHSTGDLLALSALLSEETDALVTAGAPDGSPQYPAQDPARAVPDLVAEAAGTLGLGADAAVLYLMLLALPDPTDRNCVRWTEWKPARVKKARAELAATGPVVEAKRSRAGRTLFLPCGWLERGAPGLPLETWKERLYPVAGSTRTLPHLPVPALFAAAWDRVRGGDAPGFEELDTRATRKGRRR
ncbi:hypothetical protein [Streptomyces sp. ITFR-16]|uniref:hypothetical protein n=1 Tax=Streptomyces sp. ITFR-16 TaxID=3075198 RepID=UPI00288C16E8|nr:hypothetical protein [Streptomyces sp. ITFR-16]WNI21490.1 hypothetical protein RLT58_05900 [Streptomyces sp. ITFR-16]